jgi:hypothetical protein
MLTTQGSTYWPGIKEVVMNAPAPIVAVFGSARPEIVGSKEEEARTACVELGSELAKQGWSIAVYSSDKTLIEADIVQGFISQGTGSDGSITCYYPRGANISFPEMASHSALFRAVIDPSDDWEVSFYRSLEKVDGILVLGGGPTTLIAWHIALTKGLPVVAIAEFGGSSTKLWQYLSSERERFQDEDIQTMARWTSHSAAECIASLVRQHERRQSTITAEQLAMSAIQADAQRWREHQANQRARTFRIALAVRFFVIFLGLLITGLTISDTGVVYTSVLILGLCSAGGVGATVRMLAPSPPESGGWTAPVVGVVVGLMLSLFYLVPQLIGAAGFLLPQSTIEPSTRVQYVSALLVAFLAGLGFDYALSQLIQRARKPGEEIAGSSSS